MTVTFKLIFCEVPSPDREHEGPTWTEKREHVSDLRGRAVRSDRPGASLQTEISTIVVVFHVIPVNLQPP